MRINEVARRYSKLRKRIFIRIKNRLILPLRRINEHIPEGSICELGSGLGMVGIYLALKSEKRAIVGYELNSNRVKIANEAATGLPNIKFEVKDLTKDDFDQFETFLMVDFLHHIPYEAQMMILQRISKLRSKIIIKEIDKPGFKYYLNFCCDKIMTKNDKLYFRKASSWVRIIEQMGYDVELKRIKGIFPHVVFIAHPR